MTPKADIKIRFADGLTMRNIYKMEFLIMCRWINNEKHGCISENQLGKWLLGKSIPNEVCFIENLLCSFWLTTSSLKKYQSHSLCLQSQKTLQKWQIFVYAYILCFKKTIRYLVWYLWYVGRQVKTWIGSFSRKKDVTTLRLCVYWVLEKWILLKD